MPHWRIVVHALDRTGPPMLALALLRWIRDERPEDTFDVVAFRGGELLHDLLGLGPTRVILDPHEAWDWRAPDASRVAQLTERARDLPVADATLLVSVAASQALPVLPEAKGGPVVTWIVEQGEDFHTGADARTDRWLAGSAGSRHDLLARHPDAEVWDCPEFVERPAVPSDAVRQRARLALGARDDELLVVGAGIATVRKAPDLFLEVALADARASGADGSAARRARFVWLGGEQDELFHPTRAEAQRLGLRDLRLFGSVVDVVPFLAAADVFLHPARLDSFPLVCLHAAGVGTPVVAFSGAGGVPAMFGPAFVGAPFPDIQGLHDRVRELADPTRRAEVGRAQQAAVLERFTVATGGPVVMEQLLVAAGGVTTGAVR